MTLYLDTTHFNKAVLRLKEGEEVVGKREFAAGKNLSDNLLRQIDLILRENDTKIEKLTAVEVETESKDTFTGTRIGVAVANALGYSLGAPVNGKEMVAPEYGKEPNIGGDKS